MTFILSKARVGVLLGGAAVVLLSGCGSVAAAKFAAEPVEAQAQTVAIKADAAAAGNNPQQAPEGAVAALIIAADEGQTDDTTAMQHGEQYLKALKTRLNDDTPAANVRSGPGLEFGVVGVVHDTDIITVLGHAEDSNWLQINYQGQLGWLLGDLIRNPALGQLVRPVNTDDLVPAAQATEEPVVETVELVATPTVVPTPIPTPMICGDVPVRGFGETWQKHLEVRPLLGCPFTNFRQDEHATAAAVQTFQGGWMLWLETDTVANVDPIYVFFADNGSYIRYGDRPLADAHSYGQTKHGFYKVGDRFAKIYWEDLGPVERARLGYATNEAHDSKGAFQEFANGRMFWAGEADTIYVIYEGAYDLDSDGTYVYERGWLAYEDTFETPGE
ncbi:MAG: SH3 domain-containing protein [Anaerolineae bacterium]|nr:SH3 domain-containing protein [Anaerolineae bacterium]